MDHHLQAAMIDIPSGMTPVFWIIFCIASAVFTDEVIRLRRKKKKEGRNARLPS